MRTKLTAIAALATAAVTADGCCVSRLGRSETASHHPGEERKVGVCPHSTDFRRYQTRHRCRHLLLLDPALHTRDGQAIEINNPQMTLTGKRGTLVARNQIGWIDVPDGLAVFTGTWKVISGTGDYAGLAGGGRGAGVQLANGTTKAQFEGFLNSN